MTWRKELFRGSGKRRTKRERELECNASGCFLSNPPLTHPTKKKKGEHFRELISGEIAKKFGG